MLLFNKRALRRQVRSRQNAVCIYKEGRVVTHAIVRRACAVSWGVKVDLESCHTPGFVGPLQSSWTVDCCWDFFGCTTNSWSAAYVGWTIYFDPVLIASLETIAERVENAEAHERWLALQRQLTIERQRG